MNLYLDTSAIVSLFVTEARSEAVEQLIGNAALIVISDFAEGEFAAAISRQVRMKHLTAAQGRYALDGADDWIESEARGIELTAADTREAAAYVRQFDLKLLFPDALHLALCRRAGALLVTGDKRQAEAAAALGIPVTFV